MDIINDHFTSDWTPITSNCTAKHSLVTSSWFYNNTMESTHCSFAGCKFEGNTNTFGSSSFSNCIFDLVDCTGTANTFENCTFVKTRFTNLAHSQFINCSFYDCKGALILCGFSEARIDAYNEFSLLK